MVEAELLRVRDKPFCADSSGRGAGTHHRLMSGSKFCHRLPQRVFVLPGLGVGGSPWDPPAGFAAQAGSQRENTSRQMDPSAPGAPCRA